MKAVRNALLLLASGAWCALAGAADEGLRWTGYGELGAAYTTETPAHWSKLRARVELTANGRIGERAKFKIAGRVDADGAYDLESRHYPAAVRRERRAEFMLREAYLDTSAGDWEFRLGRQHVVWGEVVGLFLADVVSARDMREFLLPEFDAMRIPQWAARAEYFAGDGYLELLWIPSPGHDDVGRPGGDFYPFPQLAASRVRERKPGKGVQDGNVGIRATRLIDGWDLSAFWYGSTDIAPTLYRVSPAPTFELRHDRIRQTGFTVSKDVGSFVFKGEAVHTRGRRFNTGDPAAEFGLRSSDTLDYVVGIDVPLEGVWRINLQHYARVLFRHDPAMVLDRYETGMTALVNRRFGDDFEAEVLLVSGLNREDYMLRPKLLWNLARNWRAQFGVDIFGGRDNGLFGRFAERDRVYAELRHWF